MTVHNPGGCSTGFDLVEDGVNVAYADGLMNFLSEQIQ
jgi:hypothetical protein